MSDANVNESGSYKVEVWPELRGKKTTWQFNVHDATGRIVLDGATSYPSLKVANATLFDLMMAIKEGRFNVEIRGDA